jgi:hypothetical protein
MGAAEVVWAMGDGQLAIGDGFKAGDRLFLFFLEQKYGTLCLHK